jgi:succinyl-CoA synthetase alpha subunit
MIAEISGPLEAEAAAWVRANMSRPVIGLPGGVSSADGAPHGTRRRYHRRPRGHHRREGGRHIRSFGL